MWCGYCLLFLYTQAEQNYNIRSNTHNNKNDKSRHKLILIYY
jgi:hypothetical protein